MSQPVITEVEDGVATITLNEPEVRNALTPAMRAALIEAVHRVEFDDSIRCVVVKGAGDHFMAGGDIRTMLKRLDFDRAERRRLIIEGVTAIHMPILAIRRMGKPVVASIQGAVAGFGIGLVGACDLAIAADDAFFTLAYCHIGASPDGGSSYFLARNVGLKHQMELALLGERFDAKRAKELGLVNWVVPRAQLAAETETLARRLANGPTVAYANAKALFNAAHGAAIETQLQMEAERIADSMCTEDHAEGVRAFLEKRKPAFRGR
ncbi:MAG TPA: enoyl-CoA hydratase-related protein [Sphingomicrobium sp.]|nr:enoyl-CoA hydratase-related protein [Sphingomicrobium sp.]